MIKFLVIALLIICSLVTIIDRGYYHHIASKNIIVILVLCFIMTLVATFRPSEMPDYENYLDFFRDNNWGKVRYEYGFVQITRLIKKISPNALLCFFSFALISISIKLGAIKKLSPFFWGSVTLYIGGMFILHDMIQMRVAVASGLLLWSTKYLYERNATKFFLIASLALLFHNSSLVIFPLWFLNINKSNKKIYLWMIPVAYALAISGITIGHFANLIPIASFQALWNMYQISMDNGVGVNINLFNIMLLIRCGICTYILFNIDVIAKYIPMAIIWAKIYTISIVALVLLSDVPVIAFRVSELYQIVEVLLIPTLILHPKFRQINKCVVLIFAWCCLFINIFYNQYM